MIKGVIFHDFWKRHLARAVVLVLVLASAIMASGCMGKPGTETRISQATTNSRESPSFTTSLTGIPVGLSPGQGPLVDIENFTEFIAVGAGSRDELRSVKALVGREYNLVAGVKKFDVLTFRNIALYKKLTEESSFPVKIRGKEYRASLTRMNFNVVDNGIYSYTGSLLGESDSDVLVTIATDALTGTIRLGNETYTITPVETRLSAQKHSSSLHIIYSSNDIEDRSFCIDSCTTPVMNQSPAPSRIPATSQYTTAEPEKPGAPAAEIMVSSTEGYTPFTVKFFDVSSGSPTSWHWDFDDGTFSDEESPVHTFYNATEPSTLKHVTLTIRREAVSSTASIDLLIHPPYPVPDFKASTLNGTAPLTVHFTDMSSGMPGSHDWNFGDGSVGFEINPDHIYDNPGIYLVNLTVWNSKASRSINTTIIVR